MTDAVVQVPPDSTGKMLDAESLTVAAQTVYRQRFELSGAAAAAIAALANAAPVGTEYALATRPIINQFYDATVGPTNITALNANLASGTPTANSCVTIATAGMETVGVAVTAVGSGTLTFQGSIDGTNWVTLNAVTPQGVIATTTTATGAWLIDCAGLANVRVTASAYASGTFTAFLRATLAEGNIGLDTPLPAGTNVIGHVIADAGSAVIGHVIADSGSTTAVTSLPSIPAGSAVIGAAHPDFNYYVGQTITAVGTSGAALTLTIPASGAGIFHYIELIEITMYAAAATTGGATPVTVTSTNLPGSEAWTFPTAMAIGTMFQERMSVNWPIKASAANTATTIVCPLTTGIIWRVNVVFFTGT